MVPIRPIMLNGRVYTLKPPVSHHQNASARF
uniref:PvuIIO n=1 Tax=Proteus vulgaris TaxID=585 RepID=Q52621_PROVU|nr:PvuIIO [Proteus vulgaris]